MAKLFLMETDGQTDLLETIPFPLPAQLLEKALSYKNHEDRNSFIAARWILHEYFRSISVRFRFDDVQYTPSGKPFLDNNYHFSIAHTGGMTGVLISEAPVGLDIELIRHIGDFKDFNQVFTNEEITGIENSGLNSFFKLWTTKEAILKLTGEGIADTTTAHSIHVQNENAAAHNGQRYHIQSFLANGLFFITIAQPVTENIAALSAYYKVDLAAGAMSFTKTTINAI